MLLSSQRDDPQRIVVLNPKGGCGKTTIATNLASYFAGRGPMPVLLDGDPQGASMRWLEKRSRRRPPIHGIAGYRNAINVTRTWQRRIPAESRQVIVDTPAGLDNPQIHDLIYDAHAVLIPVMPSAIDVGYAARFVAELLLLAQLDRDSIRVGIVASRTRRNTRSLRQLMRFLSTLRIPVVSTLRDSQAFVRATDEGLGICDLPPYQSRKDRPSVERLVAWLDGEPMPDRIDDAPLQVRMTAARVSARTH